MLLKFGEHWKTDNNSRSTTSTVTLYPSDNLSDISQTVGEDKAQKPIKETTDIRVMVPDQTLPKMSLRLEQ